MINFKNFGFIFDMDGTLVDTEPYWMAAETALIESFGGSWTHEEALQLFGQLIAGIVGTAVCKLFRLSDNFEDIRWLGGAISCASATALMALTKTVHPPAGATALLLVTDENLSRMGWFVLPMILLGCALMITTACIVNNVGRRFPVYWWTPEDLRSGRLLFRRRPSVSTEKGSAMDEGKVEPDLESATPEHASEGKASTLVNEIIIRAGEGVVVPEHLYLTEEEQQFLETLSKRL